MTGFAFVDKVVGRFQGEIAARQWFTEDDQFEVYLRVGPREFRGRVYARTLTLANVTVIDRGQGIFTDLVISIEQAAQILNADAVLVEAILNPIVEHVLVKRKYGRRLTGNHLDMLLPTTPVG
jgi:hypothetical protein